MISYKKIKSSFKTLYNILIDISQDVVLRNIDNRYVIGDGILSIFGYDSDEKCVYLRPEQSYPLYCLEVAGLDNIPRHYGDFESLCEAFSYEESSEIVIFYTKSKMVIDGDIDEFCTKQSCYIFTTEKEILEEIGTYFQVPSLLSPSRIMEALLEIGLSGNWYNGNKTFTPKPLVPIDVENKKSLYDDSSNIFKAQFADGVYGAITKDSIKDKPYRIFQGISFKSRFSPEKPDFVSALKEEWRGYIAIRLTFSQDYVKRRLTAINNSVKSFEKDQDVRESYNKFVTDIYEKNPTSFVIANVIAVVDNPKVMQRVGGYLNLSFVPKHLAAKNLLYKTMIETRDTAYDFPAYAKDMGKFIVATHKDHFKKTREPRNIYGRDISGNYVTFSFSESASVHFTLVAKTAGGKSFFLMTALKQNLGIKLRTIMEGTKPKVVVDDIGSLGTGVNVVYFDVGRSAMPLVKAIQDKNHEMVTIFSDDINLLRFGLTDISIDPKTKKMNQEDVLFMLSIISLILKLNKNEELTAPERSAITDALTYLMESNKYEGLTLKRMQEIGGYDDLIEEIKLELGEDLDLFLRIDELKDLPSKFDFLKKPLVKDIVLYLEQKSLNEITPEAEREIASSAKIKLSNVAENLIFGYYSKANIKDTPFFYMELEAIKGLGEREFIPVFLLIFQKLYRRDVLSAHECKAKNISKPRTMYIIEEAHNFFVVDLLSELFKKIIREARKHGILLGFVTQNGTDFPKEILYNIGSRIAMPGDDPEAQMDDLRHYWAQSRDNQDATTNDNSSSSEQRYIRFFKKWSKKYFAFIKCDAGMVTVNPTIGEEEKILFETNVAVESKEDDLLVT